MRLSDYGAGIFLLLPTKSAWKKAIKKEWITVDGAKGTYGKYISGGETIELNIPEEKEPKRKLVLPLDVLFEDEHLAVIHKRAGILVSGNNFFTVANALEQNLSNSSEPDAIKPLPVHRLDYPTTGLVLVGKTNSCVRALYKMFENREIQKVYYALTIGQMSNAGIIENSIDEKPSRSEYKVVDSAPSKRFGQLNLVELKPKTGRRHQLRKHLSAIGNPILGDKDYGKENLILNGKGLYLHAYSLSFNHPVTKEGIFVRDQKLDRFIKIFPTAQRLQI